MWSKAASLCDRYSVCEVARALRLNATQLRERLDESSDDEARPEFVEYRLESYAGLMAQADTPETIVEMTDRWGQRMTVRLPNDRSDTVLALACQFWGQV